MSLMNYEEEVTGGKMNKQDFIIYIRAYLEFKEECVKQNIFDIDEIIKLFETSRRAK